MKRSIFICTLIFFLIPCSAIGYNVNLGFNSGITEYIGGKTVQKNVNVWDTQKNYFEYLNAGAYLTADVVLDQQFFVELGLAYRNFNLHYLTTDENQFANGICHINYSVIQVPVTANYIIPIQKSADIINGIMNNLKRGYTTPNILHLYAVNSIYVPGSYVLSKVLEELKACAKNAYTAYESQRKGATIAIINPMTDVNVPNRGSKIDTNNPPDRDPWGTVADEAAHKVKLKVLFLAGLLDIARDIEKTLSSIQLPA